jgi:hypothetical protein
VPVIIDEKRIFNTFYGTKETTFKSTEEPLTPKDISSLSSSVTNLKDLPINLATSKFVEESGNFSFDFTFNESRFQNITANGYYSAKEKNLSINLRFILEKELYEDNRKTTKTYQVDFSISSTNIEIQSLNKKVEKENIYDFLNRVMNDITKILNDDKKNLTGVVFEKEDLAELLGLGDKEVGRLLREIVLIIQTMANLKKMKNQDAENILYTPKRISQNVVEFNKTNSSSFDMKMSIEEVSKSE